MARIARAQPWLGTCVDIRAEHEDATILAASVRSAFALIGRIHVLMSVHDPESELSRINRSAHLARRPIAGEIRVVLAAALDLAAQSAGVFDPAIGGKLAQVGQLPASATESDARATWQDIDLNAEGVRFTRPLTLDFGGIAKGYAVDRALALLRNDGCTSATVNAGGDLARFGPSHEQVHVRDPRGGYLALLEIKQGAVASSCYALSRKIYRGRWSTPLVDPRTNRCAMPTKSATVTADTCMMADALTKTVLLLGNRSSALLRQYNASAVTLAARGGKLSLKQLPASTEARLT